MHAFIRQSGRGIEPAEGDEGCGTVAGFLDEFAGSTHDRLFGGLDRPRAALPETLAERDTVIADEHDPSVIEDRHHNDRAGVTDDLAERLLAALTDGEKLEVELAALVEHPPTHDLRGALSIHAVEGCGHPRG